MLLTAGVEKGERSVAELEDQGRLGEKVVLEWGL